MGGKTESPPQKSSKKNEQLNDSFVSTFQTQVETVISEKQALLPRRISIGDSARRPKKNHFNGRQTGGNSGLFVLYGAVEPLTGERFFLELPRLTGECFQIFINQLSATFPNTLNLMVLDNGRCQVVVIPDNVVNFSAPLQSRVESD